MSCAVLPGRSCQKVQTCRYPSALAHNNPLRWEQPISHTAEDREVYAILTTPWPASPFTNTSLILPIHNMLWKTGFVIPFPLPSAAQSRYNEPAPAKVVIPDVRSRRKGLTAPAHGSAVPSAGHFPCFGVRTVASASGAQRLLHHACRTEPRQAGPDAGAARQDPRPRRPHH